MVANPAVGFEIVELARGEGVGAFRVEQLTCDRLGRESNERAVTPDAAENVVLVAQICGVLTGEPRSDRVAMPTARSLLVQVITIGPAILRAVTTSRKKPSRSRSNFSTKPLCENVAWSRVRLAGDTGSLPPLPIAAAVTRRPPNL